MGAEANGDSQRSREVLLAALAEEEAELRRLEGATDEARSRIASLQTQLAALGPEPVVRVYLPVLTPARAPQTADEKVRLFRELFRGRVDVFPTRFVSQKTSKASYAPACTNKFVRGVCELSRIKCSDCTNQAFRAVTDKVIRKSSSGRARDGGVPAARGRHVLVSRGGLRHGSVARRMGSYLITETMNRRHDLPMNSSDRLFPSQDTWPRGGFGTTWSRCRSSERPAPRDVIDRWMTFRRNHREAIGAVDFFTVPTVRFRVLYAFFVLHHDRRHIVHLTVTEHPTSAWVCRQLREAFPDDTAPRFLIADRDSTFSAEVRTRAEHMGVRWTRTSPR